MGRKELKLSCAVSDDDMASMDTSLSKLVDEGVLYRLERGMYQLVQYERKTYIYVPSDAEQELSRKIRAAFPGLQHTVWSPRCLVPYMQHVPDLTMMLVDVEMREGAESVFHYLQDQLPGRNILLRPDREECDKYLYLPNTIVVRTLVGRAPLVRVNDVLVPSMEKILVDALKDPELHFAQGAELYHIYANVEETFVLHLAKMRRYADRRNRGEELETIWSVIDKEKQETRKTRVI